MACKTCDYGPEDVCGMERPHYDPDFDPKVRGVCDCACHDRVVGYDSGDHGIYCVGCAQGILGPVLVDTPIHQEDANGKTCTECGDPLGG